MIRFRCPKCDAKVEVDESFAGRAGRCATCGYDFRVPKTGEVTPVHGMVEPSRPGATVVKVRGETVEILPPLEIMAVAATVVAGLSVVAVLVIGLSRLWTPPWAVGMALGALLALLSVVMALSAYSSIASSRGRKRGKKLATAALGAGGGLFLVYLVGAIVGFVMWYAWRPDCEKNLEVISVALANYAKAHNGAFPDGHKTNLKTLVEERYLASADWLTCPAYRVVAGTQTYDLTPDVNNRDFPPETMLVSDGQPLDTHTDSLIRVLLISGKVIKVPIAEWSKFKAAQVAKWNEILNRIRQPKADAAAGGTPATPDITPPAAPKPAAPVVAPPAAPKPAAPAPKKP
jgi:hypothetical protein